MFRFFFGDRDKRATPAPRRTQLNLESMEDRTVANSVPVFNPLSFGNVNQTGAIAGNVSYMASHPKPAPTPAPVLLNFSPNPAGTMVNVFIPGTSGRTGTTTVSAGVATTVYIPQDFTLRARTVTVHGSTMAELTQRLKAKGVNFDVRKDIATIIAFDKYRMIEEKRGAASIQQLRGLRQQADDALIEARGRYAEATARPTGPAGTSDAARQYSALANDLTLQAEAHEVRAVKIDLEIPSYNRRIASYAVRPDPMSDGRVGRVRSWVERELKELESVHLRTEAMNLRATSANIRADATTLTQPTPVPTPAPPPRVPFQSIRYDSAGNYTISDYVGNRRDGVTAASKMGQLQADPQRFFPFPITGGPITERSVHRLSPVGLNELRLPISGLLRAQNITPTSFTLVVMTQDYITSQGTTITFRTMETDGGNISLVREARLNGDDAITRLLDNTFAPPAWGEQAARLRNAN